MEIIPKSENTSVDIIDGGTEKNIGGKKYVIKSVFVGEHDIKSKLLKLAERKAIREMGLDSIAV